MLQLRTLGGLGLRGCDDREIDSVLRRPKYLALLTYLAVAQSRGYHRRDTLVSLFWPELDQPHARSALRQAIHYLRRTLGQNAFAARGEEELSVDASFLWCDAAEFALQLAHDVRSATALELYRGDFLQGFHLSGAPDFERWMEDQRARFRRQAATAASALSNSSEREGNLLAAIDWARRAAELSNREEEQSRRLIELLAVSGDKEAALREYHSLRRRLVTELEVEPSPATNALIERIRSDTSRLVTRAPQREELEDRPADVVRDQPSDAMPPSRRPSRRRRNAFLTLAAAGTVSTMLVAGWLWSQSLLRTLPRRGGSDASDSPERGLRVAVFPFKVQGSAELKYLEEGFAELISDAIDGLGDLRRVRSAALTNMVNQGDVGRVLDQQWTKRAALALGARHFVLGTVVDGGRQLVFTAALFDAGASASVAQASITTDREGLAAAANQLTRDLLADVPVGDGARLTRLGAAQTKSFPALKAYARGEALLRQAFYDSAAAKFATAVSADSMFTLAWYRLGLTRALAQSMGHKGDNYASLTRAMQHRERLSERDRLLLTGWYAHFHGRSDLAERVARQVIGGDPANAEAWHLLGFTRMWYAWQRGHSYGDARAAHERALAIDPRFPDAIFHGTWAAILDERYAYADSLFRTGPTGLVTGPWAHVTRGLFVFRRNDRKGQEAYVKTLETIDDQSLLGIGWILASHSDSLVAARRWLSRFDGTAEHSDWGRVSGGIFLAHLEAARGRWSEARALFQRAARFDPGTALSSYAWLAAMPFFDRPVDELLAIRDSVRDWQVHPLPRDSGRVHPQALPEVLSIPDELRPWARDYLLGLLSVRLGDRAEAERYASRLERAVDPVDRVGLRRDLALEIRASLALADGKPDSALALLERATMSVAHSDQVWYSPYYARPLGRYLRGEALRLLGRDEEALGWYGTLGEKYGTEFLYRAPAFLREAEIHERRGAIDQASRRYQRFIIRWQQADPEYQPLVQRASDRARALAIGMH